MITKFYKYNENIQYDSDHYNSAEKFQKKIVDLLKNRYNFKTNLEIFILEDGIELINNSLEEDDVHPMSVGYIFRVDYDGEEYQFSCEGDEEEYDNINDLINKITEYLNYYEQDYYENLDYDCNIAKVIIFNIDDFSKFVLYHINKNNIDDEYLNNLKQIYTYLNDSTKAKIAMYLKAKKI